MGALTEFSNHMDWQGMLMFLMSAVACLICLTIHELSHGLIARQLGDPTAKVNGRLTLNPLAHIDWVGLFLLLTVGVGWAKPVPVDMRNFRNPKAGMAATALAGPISNFLLALVCICLGGFVLRSGMEQVWSAYVLLFLCQLAVLNVGLGVFNLIHIPPLDGSRVVSAFLPDRAYLWLMKRERFLIVAVVLLAWSGLLGGPLEAAIAWVMKAMCHVAGFPFAIMEFYFF